MTNPATHENKMKTYLGDSIYAEFDGFHIVLYTDNGRGPNLIDKIYLEDSVLNNLNKLARRCFGSP